MAIGNRSTGATARRSKLITALAARAGGLLRWKAALAAVLTVTVLGVGSAAPAFAVTQPSIQFGFSDGGLTDASSSTTVQNGYPNELDVLSNVLGPSTGSFVRGAVHWVPTAVSGPDITGKYNGVILKSWQDGLTFLPEIHTSDSSSSSSCTPGDCYTDPLTCSGPGCGTSNFETAIENFVEYYAPGGTFAQNNPGFPGITRYEVWNEPNTPTGHIDTNSGDMPASEFVPIMEAESTALRIGASTSNPSHPSGWLSQLQIACCAFGNSGLSGYSYGLDYLKALVAQDPNIWSYISPTGAQPGVITTHQYYKNIPPSSCLSSGTPVQKCVQYLDTWRTYLNGITAAKNDALGITEGGYSAAAGSCADNQVSAAQQAQWDAYTIQYIQTDSNPLDVAFLSYYKAFDDTADSNYAANCKTEGNAPVVASGTIGDESWKPWAANLHLFAESSDTQAPTVTDTFTRSDTGSWGSADTGGAYTLGGTSSDFSVNGAKGIITQYPASAGTDTANLNAMTAIGSQNDSIDAVVSALPSSGNTETFILGARKAPSVNTYYQARYQVDSTGSVTITLRKVVGGTATTLGTPQAAACTFTANHLEHLTFNLIGASPTHLSASCYADTDGIDGGSTGSTPATAADSDTSGNLQTTGTNLIATTASSGTLPFTTKYDSLSISAP